MSLRLFTLAGTNFYQNFPPWTREDPIFGSRTFCPTTSQWNTYWWSSFKGGAMATWLVRSTLNRAVRVQGLTGDIVLCSWARQFTLTVSLFTRLYKWVPANVMLGLILRWTSIPSTRFIHKRRPDGPHFDGQKYGCFEASRLVKNWIPLCKIIIWVANYTLYIFMI